MPGEKLGSTKGRITTTRVLPEGALEHSVEERGTLLGLEVAHFVTFEAARNAQGVLEARGRGRFLTEDGDTAAWEARGVVRMLGPGFRSSIRAVGMAAAPPGGKLARLNEAPVLFEVEVDAQGQLQMTCHAWR